MALNANGVVTAWGDNSSGQINGRACLTNIVAIAAGYAHGLALKADGTVAAWGSNIRVPQMSECALGSWMELCLAPAGDDF